MSRYFIIAVAVGFIVLTVLLLYLDFGLVRVDHDTIGTG